MYQYIQSANTKKKKKINPKIWQTVLQEHTIYKDVILGHWQLKGVRKSYKVSMFWYVIEIRLV